MIYLDINTPKSVVVTLTEVPNIYLGLTGYALPAYFTWKIKDADTGNTYIFTADDISVAPWYYNQFTFSVQPGATYGLTQGIIPAYQGVYEYYVYQTQNQYDLSTSGPLLERGIMNIEGTVSVISTLTQSITSIPTLKNL